MDAIIGFIQFLFFIALVLGGVALYSYNKLQILAQEVKEKSSNVQVVISKKLSLINQMIDLVKNYQESEQFTYLKISQDTNTANMMQAYSQSGMLLTSLQGMAERFPNLRASEQYHRLGDNIEHCEEDIQDARQTYNAAVKGYNGIRLSIPTVFVSRFLGFSEAPYLEFDLSSMTDVTSLKEFKTDDGQRLEQLFTGAGNQLLGVTRTLVGQAGQISKALTEKIIDQPDAKQYFYMIQGLAPKGPVGHAQLTAMSMAGEIDSATLVAEVGSQDWVSYEIFTQKDAPTTAPEHIPEPKCPGCGVLVVADDSFCGDCGYTLH